MDLRSFRAPLKQERKGFLVVIFHESLFLLQIAVIGFSPFLNLGFVKSGKEILGLHRDGHRGAGDSRPPGEAENQHDQFFKPVHGGKVPHRANNDVGRLRFGQLRFRSARPGRIVVAMSDEGLSLIDIFNREMAACLDVLNGLSTVDRIRVRSAVNKLSGAIDEIREEQKAISETDPESHLGPLLAEKIGELENLRLRLLFAVAFDDFELTVEPSRSGDLANADGNIYRDGELLAHARLFDLE